MTSWTFSKATTLLSSWTMPRKLILLRVTQSVSAHSTGARVKTALFGMLPLFLCQSSIFFPCFSSLFVRYKDLTSTLCFFKAFLFFMILNIQDYRHSLSSCTRLGSRPRWKLWSKIAKRSICSPQATSTPQRRDSCGGSTLFGMRRLASLLVTLTFSALFLGLSFPLHSSLLSIISSSS